LYKIYYITLRKKGLKCFENGTTPAKNRFVKEAAVTETTRLGDIVHPGYVMFFDSNINVVNYYIMVHSELSF